MNRVNYHRELKSLIENNIKNSVCPKLLLHSCCAPCSSTCIEILSKGFDLTVYFYNPNLDTSDEYYHRQDEQIRLCQALNIKYVVEEYDSSDFFQAVKGLEKIREGGERCFSCFRLRLNKTAIKAKELSFDYFATTLTLSPLKNAEKINQIGSEIETELNIKYLPTDFKKEGGYLRSIEPSKEYNLYRQSYCGCVFSKIEREKLD